jgi:hypothetical protein
MQIKSEILDALDDYHIKSLTMQEYYFDGLTAGVDEEELREIVDDDLVFHVPIYDMLDRKYAAFCSFLEALDKRENDPKGHGVRFKDHRVSRGIDKFMLYYLFRLCGSGINYKPESHGFGNFWVVKSILNGRYMNEEWLQDLPVSQFSDNKGYLLPQFSIGLRVFILRHAYALVEFLYSETLKSKHSIKEFVDKGNEFLKSKGFKRQTFVLSAFAADVAEYHPELVDRESMIYAGTNAQKCIKAIFGRCKPDEAIAFLAERYGAVPYSIEDSRLCDPVRYFLEYQSRDHIQKNGGKVYKNNSILKKIWTEQEYQNFQSQLRK